MERKSVLMDGIINIVKVPPLPKGICRFSAMPMKIAKAFFTEIEKKFSNLFWNCERPKITKATLQKKSRAGEITVPDF